MSRTIKKQLPELNWTKARDALDALTANGEDPNAAMESLATYLRLGKLRAQAKQVWISEEVTVEKAWKARPEPAEPGGLEPVPVTFWRTDKNWIEDVRLWRWPVDRFHTTLRIKPPKRRIFRGVRFSRGDLERLFPDHFHEGRRKGARGPLPDVSRRDTIWLQLFQMALEGQFAESAKNFETQGELETAVYDALNPEGRRGSAGRNKVSEVVRQAYHKLKN